VNGLGWSGSDAEAESAIFEALFTFLPDTSGTFMEWKRIVATLGIIGVQVHDARLFAVCQVHNISSIPTFNSAHFERFKSLNPNYRVIDPSSVT
jgi:predicted nucleic acid-binding protein